MSTSFLGSSVPSGVLCHPASPVESEGKNTLRLTTIPPPGKFCSATNGAPLSKVAMRDP